MTRCKTFALVYSAPINPLNLETFLNFARDLAEEVGPQAGVIAAWCAGVLPGADLGADKGPQHTEQFAD